MNIFNLELALTTAPSRILVEVNKMFVFLCRLKKTIKFSFTGARTRVLHRDAALPLHPRDEGATAGRRRRGPPAATGAAA